MSIWDIKPKISRDLGHHWPLLIKRELCGTQCYQVQTKLMLYIIRKEEKTMTNICYFGQDPPANANFLLSLELNVMIAS